MSINFLQADAVNIMLYSAPLPGETIGYAVWDIYPSSSSGMIRKFLKEEYPLEHSPVQYVDPIHSQYFYLTPVLRRKLYERYAVQSWRIYQKPGDAVFIPAGCAHQVNVTFYTTSRIHSLQFVGVQSGRLHKSGSRLRFPRKSLPLRSTHQRVSK